MRSGVARVVPVAVLLVLFTAVTSWSVVSIGYLTKPHHPMWFATQGASWVLFVAAVLLLRRVPNRAVPALVLVGALAVGAAALVGPPTTSTDSARYAWDGMVQDSGVSPYRYAPEDPALSALRPDWLFPTGTVSSTGVVECPEPSSVLPSEVATLADQAGGRAITCTAINRAQVTTIYPPVAEVTFAAVRLLVPRTVTYLPMQVLGLLATLATTALLLVVLRRSGRDPRRAAWWAWCPFVLSEAITNAHIDGFAVLLGLAGTALAAGRKPLRAGVLLGLGIAVKLLPVLLLPAVLRRSPIRIAAAALLTVAVVYVPYVLSDGAGVLGYLPGYLHEEGYDSGSRSALVSMLFPAQLVTPIAAVLLLGVALAVLIRTDPAAPWGGQVVLVGSALLLTSPSYSWYSLLLVPFIAMTGWWEWFAVPIVLTLAQLGLPLLLFRIDLVGVVLLITIASLVRRRGTRRRALHVQPVRAEPS